MAIRKIFFYVGTELLGTKVDPSLKDSFGYARNVFQFMKSLKTGGQDVGDWDFCVNTAKGDTTTDGERIFKYYRPAEEFAGKDDGREKYITTKYLAAPETQEDSQDSQLKKKGGGEPVSMGSITTAALRTEAEGQPISLPEDRNGGSYPVSNSSGRCRKSDLDDLEEALEGRVDKEDIVFSVCDCNSFHNSGYLFGRLALRRACAAEDLPEKNAPALLHDGVKENPLVKRIGPPVLIVNLDTHSDDTCTKGLVNSDGWGSALLGEFDCGAYVVIGVPGRGTKLHVTVQQRKGRRRQALVLTKAMAMGLTQEVATSTKKAKDHQDEANRLQKQAERTKKRGDEKQAKKLGKKAKECEENARKAKKVAEDSKSKLDNAIPGNAAIGPDDLKTGSGKALRSKLDGLWKHLEKIIGNGRGFKYYCVTVDRDCMVHSHTQWGHDGSAFRDAAHVRATLEVVAESLRDHLVTLRGFDITGLPEQKGKGGKSREHGDLCDGTGTCTKCGDTEILNGLPGELGKLYERFRDAWSKPLGVKIVEKPKAKQQPPPKPIKQQQQQPKPIKQQEQPKPIKRQEQSKPIKRQEQPKPIKAQQQSKAGACQAGGCPCTEFRPNMFRPNLCVCQHSKADHEG